MTVYIILDGAGANTGPFNLYSDLDGFSVPFETVSRATLLAGYTSTIVPYGTTVIRVMSDNTCQNYSDIPVSTTTTSTTVGPTTLNWAWTPTGDVTTALYIQNVSTLSYLVNEKLDASDSGSVTVPIATYSIYIFWNGGNPQPIKFRLCDTTTNTELYYVNYIGELPPFFVEITVPFTPIPGHSYNLDMVNGTAEPATCI